MHALLRQGYRMELSLTFMVPRVKASVVGYHKNGIQSTIFWSEISLETVLLEFYHNWIKGLCSRALLKISLLADFRHFLQKSLNFIFLQPNLAFGFNIVSLVLTDQKIIIIMTYYDFIVNFENLDFMALFWPSKKRDEP